MFKLIDRLNDQGPPPQIGLRGEVGVFIATRETFTLPVALANQTQRFVSGRRHMARGTIRQRSKVKKDSWTVQTYLGGIPRQGRSAITPSLSRELRPKPNAG